jgi:CRP-like cAMP-binding protein
VTGGVPNAGEQQTLHDAGRSRRYLAKEVIYRESDRADRICVIRSGLVKLLSYLPNGRARIVRLHAVAAGQPPLQRSAMGSISLK